MIVENQNTFCLLAAAEKAAEEACHSGQTAFKWVHYSTGPTLRAAIRRRGRGFLVRFRRPDGYGEQHERSGGDRARSKVRAGRFLFSVSSVISCRIAPAPVLRSIAEGGQRCGGWTPPLHYSTTPFPTRFPATFPAVFLCMGWRQAASPRSWRGGIKTVPMRSTSN